jgi:signal transduction histidine kinase
MSVLFVVILGALLIAYSAALYITLSNVIYGKIDQDLRQKVRAINDTVAAYSNLLEPNYEITPKSLNRTISFIDAEQTKLFDSPKIKGLDKEWRDNLLGLGLNHDYTVVFYPDGGVMEKSGNIPKALLPELKQAAFSATSKRLRLMAMPYGTSNLKVIIGPSYRDNKLKNILVVATSTESSDAILRGRFSLILITVPAVLLVSILFAWFFVIKSLRPIKEITTTINEITYKDMNKQVEVQLTDKEIVGLKDALNKMIARLHQSFSNINEFSSNVAHELKTPIAIIRGEAEVALLKDRDAEEYQRVIGVILEEGKRMLKTIDDLLLVNKIDYQTEVFQFEPIETSEFFSEIIEQAKIVAAPKNIAVKSEVPPSSKFINGNKLHLRRLFFNLIDNAIKFTAPKGTISIKLAYVDSRLRVEVSDSGVGIAPADLKRIYDRFFHVDRTSWGNVPGSGLGLSIAKSIAQLHHGTLDVRSELGKGTTFTVSLPLIK